MTKEEARLSVMGAISMALKDSTLQQGFEIICKELSDFEKENAELKAYNEKLLNGDIEKHNKIVELVNENAELKKGLSVVNASNGFNKEQLAEAKEVIKDLIEEYHDFCRLHGFLTESNCITRAEQFLEKVSK